jgi:hypothetical protein
LVHSLQGKVECRSHPLVLTPMPHKHNADRRHHILLVAGFRKCRIRRNTLGLWDYKQRQQSVPLNRC